MTREELAREITRLARGREDRSLCQADVEAVLKMLGTVTAQELAAGGEVPLHGLGKLKARQRAARMGRNPRTGAPLYIPACRVVVFAAGKELTRCINT